CGQGRHDRRGHLAVRSLSHDGDDSSRQARRRGVARQARGVRRRARVSGAREVRVARLAHAEVRPRKRKASRHPYRITNAGGPVSRYQFLIETYRTERLKTLSVWSQIPDARLSWRPEPRGRTPLEHMVHQCLSEHAWMSSMLGINVATPVLPDPETRLG